MTDAAIIGSVVAALTFVLTLTTAIVGLVFYIQRQDQSVSEDLREAMDNLRETDSRARYDLRNEMQALMGKSELIHRGSEGRITALEIDAVRRSDIVALRTDIKEQIVSMKADVNTRLDGIAKQIDRMQEGS